MDFIPAVPAAQFPGGPPALMAAQGVLARELQATEAFPEPWDFRTVVARLLSLAETRFVPGLLDPHRAALAQLQERLEWDSVSHVSSHNDPNPRNVLYDGTRLWLVDWETACRNDPFVDIAIMADQPGITVELAGTLLTAWLGRSATPAEKHRLAEVTLLTRLYYAGLLFAVAGPPAEKLADLSAPSPAEFAARLAGATAPSPDILLTMATMRLRDFLAGCAALDGMRR
jgi:Ser/Thr protein kinase RdoA (MazF antagonist)